MDLHDYREEIDKIDDELLRLFQKRMGVCLKIAEYKKERGMPALDASREEEKLCKIAEKADEGLRPYAGKLYTTLFELSRNYQESILK